MAYKLTYVAGNAPFSQVDLPADAYGDGVQQPITIYESYCSQTYNLNIEVYLDELRESCIQTIPFDMDVSSSAHTYKDESGQSYTVGDEVGLTANVVLTPDWDSNYTLETKEVDLSELNIPNKPGYTFAGWGVLSGEQIVNNKLVLESSPINTDDRVIYANWTPNLITVQVEYLFQSLDDPDTYVGDAALTTTVSGYADEYCVPPVVDVQGFMTPDPDTIYLGDYAEAFQPLFVYSYDRAQYTLTIHQAEGLSITIKYGDKTVNNVSSITAPYETQIRITPVALEGYEFLGWSSTQNEEDIFSQGEFGFKLTGTSTTPYPICKKIIPPEPEDPNINVNVGKSWKSAVSVYVLKDGQWKTK